MVVTALPAHSSHVTHFMDVGVFSTNTSHLQNQSHRAVRQKTVLNIWDVSQCISNVYSSSHTVGNIRSASHQSGVWDMKPLKTNVLPLEEVLYQTKDRLLETLTASMLLDCFGRRHCTLLGDKVVQEEGHVRVTTTFGAHLTSDAVLEAIQK